MTTIVSVHYLRRRARQAERELQHALDHGLHPTNVPTWAHGVHVEKAGPFQWAIVATKTRGH